ncbi:hypothetical protein LXL04_014699 [Taraxacum kok-saghyz]
MGFFNARYELRRRVELNVKHVDSGIVADERHRKKMQERIITNLEKFRTVLPLALQGGEGITNNFGAVLDLFAPASALCTVQWKDDHQRQ